MVPLIQKLRWLFKQKSKDNVLQSLEMEGCRRRARGLSSRIMRSRPSALSAPGIIDKAGLQQGRFTITILVLDGVVA